MSGRFRSRTRGKQQQQLTHAPKPRHDPASALLHSPPDAPGSLTVALSAGSSDDAGSAASRVSAPPPQLVQFPWALHGLLEDESVQHILSWCPSGKAFRVHSRPEFERVVLLKRRYFNQSKYK